MFLVRFGGELLSHVLRRSTIAAAALNFRVRDGIGCFARAMATKPEKKHTPRTLMWMRGVSGARPGACSHANWLWVSPDYPKSLLLVGFFLISLVVTGSNQAYRAISTGQLNALLRLHLRPIDVMVYHGSQGDLVLRGASRLDAFSGYPVRS